MILRLIKTRSCMHAKRLILLKYFNSLIPNTHYLVIHKSNHFGPKPSPIQERSTFQASYLLFIFTYWCKLHSNKAQGKTRDNKYALKLINFHLSSLYIWCLKWWKGETLQKYFAAWFFKIRISVMGRNHQSV